jgi:hypothetical protein
VREWAYPSRAGTRDKLLMKSLSVPERIAPVHGAITARPDMRDATGGTRIGFAKSLSATG